MKNFNLILNSDHSLSKTIKKCDLDLASNQITFEAEETENFDWIDWLIELPDKESLSCFLLDSKKKAECYLLLEGLYIECHEVTYGDMNSQETHKITVSFVSVQRMNRHIAPSKSVSSPVLLIREDKSN